MIAMLMPTGSSSSIAIASSKSSGFPSNESIRRRASSTVVAGFIDTSVSPGSRPVNLIVVLRQEKLLCAESVSARQPELSTAVGVETAGNKCLVAVAVRVRPEPEPRVGHLRRTHEYETRRVGAVGI